MKKLFYALVLLIGIAGKIDAQTMVHTGDMFQGGVNDGVKLVEYYIKPVNKAIISGINNTEYNNMRLYEDDKKRFSVSLRLSTIIIPEEDTKFRVDTMEFETIKVDSGQYAQTVFGDTIGSVVFVSKDSTLDTTGTFPNWSITWKPVFRFNSPPGSGYRIMPIPYLQAGYNFGFGYLSVNLVPATPALGSDMSLLLFGVAWQQDLLPFIKDKPFGLSAVAGFNTIKAWAHLHVEPDANLVNFDKSDYDDQYIKVNYLNLYVSLYATYYLSEKISFYGGAGYTSGKSNISVLGTYPVYEKDPTGQVSVTVKNIKDPMENSEVTYNRMKFVLGTNVNLGSWYLQGNYTFADYAGMGFVLGKRF